LNSFDGKTIKLSDYTDNPTLVVFWASWCPHCVRELPVLDRMYKDLHSKGLNMLAIDLDSTTSAGKNFAESHHISFPNRCGQRRCGRQIRDNRHTIDLRAGQGRGGQSQIRGRSRSGTLRADLAKLGVK